MDRQPALDEPLLCPTCQTPLTSENRHGTVRGVCFHDLWLFHCRECHQPCMGMYVGTHCQIWGINHGDEFEATQMYWRCHTAEREEMTAQIGYDPLYK